MIKELIIPVVLSAVNPQVECLTEAIYFEGRSESFIGQLAIANVILNRVKSKKYPNNVCGVVHEKNQFSYYWDGKPEIMNDSLAIEVAYKVASISLVGASVDTINGATHYHATYVKPSWSYKLQYLSQIGLHKFYKED